MECCSRENRARFDSLAHHCPRAVECSRNFRSFMDLSVCSDITRVTGSWVSLSAWHATHTHAHTHTRCLLSSEVTKTETPFQRDFLIKWIPATSGHCDLRQTGSVVQRVSGASERAAACGSTNARRTRRLRFTFVA